MNPIRKKRLYLIGMMVTGVGVAAWLALNAFDENLMFFFSPSEVVAGKAPTGHPFRIGGLVANDSVKRKADGLTTAFDVTDNDQTVTVEYTGILPDLFREGQGIVALGQLNEGGVFIADEVLAKHDENYMPPEVAASLKSAHDTAVGAPQSEASVQ
jgi:cytochrome c-type biogenesis protein CcmE